MSGQWMRGPNHSRAHYLVDGKASCSDEIDTDGSVAVDPDEIRCVNCRKTLVRSASPGLRAHMRTVNAKHSAVLSTLRAHKKTAPRPMDRIDRAYEWMAENGMDDE